MKGFESSLSFNFQFVGNLIYSQMKFHIIKSYIMGHGRKSTIYRYKIYLYVFGNWEWEMFGSIKKRKREREFEVNEDFLCEF